MEQRYHDSGLLVLGLTLPLVLLSSYPFAALEVSSLGQLRHHYIHRGLVTWFSGDLSLLAGAFCTHDGTKLRPRTISK